MGRKEKSKGRGGPLLGRLENLLNHFDTIHLSNKNFLTGVCPIVDRGGGMTWAAFFMSAFVYTYFKQKKNCLKKFKDVLYLYFKYVLTSKVYVSELAICY
jgi:hypothetical protein